MAETDLERWAAIEEKIQAGHKLRDSGKPFVLSDGAMQRAPARVGLGLCECGATSRRLQSDVSRRRWHSEHLDSLGIGHRAVAAAYMDQSRGAE